MKTWKSAGLSFVLLLLSLCVSFVIGEVVLRLIGYRGAPQSFIGNIYEVQDPILDWRYTPGSEVWLGGLIFRYNKAGFRDVDHEVGRQKGVTRIVVVGDSVSEGNGVKTEAVFSRVLQAKLGPGYEVINVAASGLNTPQEVHLFEAHGLQYEPDVVVLNFVLNDIDFYSNLAGQRRYYAEMDKRIGILGLSINPELKRLLKSSALIYFLKEQTGNLIQRLSGVDSTGADYYTGLWSDERNREKATTAFDRLLTLKKKHSFDVVVIIWPLIVEYADYRFAWIHNWIEQEAEKRGFVSIDLLPEFSKMHHRKLQVAIEDTVHPNARGHALAADVFLNWYKLSNGKGRAVPN
jgi:lysophospholipase L1-like esterase